MKPEGLATLIWFLALTETSHAQPFNCNISGATQNPGAKLPILSQNYQATVAVSIVDKNYSVVIDEHVDYDGRRAALTVHKGGNIENLIFSYNTNEVFYILNQTCRTYTVDSNPYSFLLSSSPAANSNQLTIVDAVTAIQTATDSKPVYYGSDTVRGIPADKWSTCFSWKNATGRIQAIYYFSKLGWETSSSQQPTLLRIEAHGQPSPGTTDFYHIYDFINYIPNIDADPSTFTTPPHVVCLNRKPSKPVPDLAPDFKYRAEIVDSRKSYISHYAVWYDEKYKMLREDSRTKQTSPDNQDIILNTTTEIRDFNTGVQYIINSTGCSIKAIDASDADTDQDVDRFQYNGTLVVDMRDPNSFFVSNGSYAFAGQRTIRGITCDVFSAIIANFTLDGATYHAIFEYAFLADGWNDLPLYATETDVQHYPVQLVISIPSVNYSRVYNYFEFAEDVDIYPTFDVSNCFDEKQKLGFQLTFPGAYNLSLQDQWTATVYTTLVQTMNIFPIRVGGITISNDEDNVYVNAYVLTSSALAQFEKLPQFTLEHENDKVMKGVTTADECAALCIDNTDFVCEGFQYCQYDGFACSLSKDHLTTHKVTFNATACDEYTRSIKVATKREPLVSEAYTLLLNAVQQGTFQIQITDNQGNALPTYVALDVQLISGNLVQSRPLPSLPTAFSYRLETVVPSSSTVEETYVWYDQSLSLVRFDTRDPYSDEPYTLTHIHDFSIGVAYQINQVTDECTISPIASSGLFDVTTGSVSSTRNGGLIVTMSSPNALFFLDDTYTYVGQSTTRGILCDVFESKRGDFDMEYYNTTTQDTVFKYYFQANSWTYNSPQASSSTQNQPVQLKIEDRSTGSYLIYNFYDFAEQHFPARFYDTTPCYSPDERKNFVIIFKDQPYHPNLDEVSSVFLSSALDQLAELTYTSPINFQRATLTYDDDDVYLIVTALGHTSLINLFTPVMKVAHNTSVSQINALSLDDCASACVLAPNFICNSFDYCVDTSIPNCLLGTQHAESEGDTSSANGPCTHFSRTENGTKPGMSVQKMYDAITDAVYQDQFQITVTLLNGTKVKYVSTDVRDDILRPTDPDGTAGGYMQKFVITPGYQMDQSLIAETHSSVSVTDCAMYCIQENTFDCQAFDYQFSLRSCRLSNIHPDELNSTYPGVTTNQFSAVYARFFTAEYTKYDAEVFGTDPDKTIPSIKSDELCARACTENADFVCESFEICVDGSCLLRKTHILGASPSDVTQNPNCTHYSRNHLYDYIRRNNKIIQGHDDRTIDVGDASVCAQICGSGNELPLCASFEVCQVQQGQTACILSTADPTQQKDIQIVDSMQCTLYTRANPQSNGVNPTVTTTGTNSAVTRASGTNTQQAQSGGSGCVGNAKVSSETGPRVGIAFGTLFLGLLVGAGSMFLFIRYRFGKHGDQEGGTMLKTWDS